MPEGTIEVSKETALAQPVLDKVIAGRITLADLLKEISPTEPVALVPMPQAPLPVAITVKQREALDRVTEVFASVVPKTRRALEPREVHAIIEERMTLDELEDLAEKRKDAIRTTICNHLDVKAEQSGEATDAPRDAKGHYVLKGKAGVPDMPKVFSRELRTNAPTLDVEALEEMVQAGELDRADFLAMTTQTRIVDENKVMLALKKDPSLVRVLAQATRPGSKTASVYLRDNKK
jgi:hypothetical protein